ncbi:MULTISPECIES: hypothetical protein [unclassified Pseudomonas]|uniref:hypothetical protein n=1 Tax=unclassified Pseudomonas TaxID=196821 RepID=UPI0029293069|nr:MULTISPECIES: hypothetical protein [unclassified Pseudomonas]MDU9413836.1 hypothetical protein [Pseudomonas sp. zfem005]MDW3716739.1 hypothetical protein [Pseudomonas sp. 2023EL-01195]
MPVEMHLPPSRATLMQVIHVSAVRGDGTPSNPERSIDLYFRTDGELLACYDPINGPADIFGRNGYGYTPKVTEEAQIG